MGKIKSFFRALVLSFTSPQYYVDILRANLSFSLKYYFGATFLLALILTFIIMVRWVIPFTGFLYEVPDLLLEVYPEELIVSINNGQVSTNVTEPYFIPLSVLKPIENSFNENVLGSNEADIQNLLVIDTQAEPDEIDKYSTWALLTWDSVSYLNDNGNIEIVSLKDVENTTINRELVESFLMEIAPLIKYIIPVASVLIIIAYLLFGVFRLVYIFIVTLAVWAVSKIINSNITYSKTYQLALHFTFIPYFTLSLLSLFSLSVSVPFLELGLQTLVGVGIVALIKPHIFQSKS